jgi:hypothetical protein
MNFGLIIAIFIIIPKGKFITKNKNIKFNLSIYSMLKIYILRQFLLLESFSIELFNKSEVDHDSSSLNNATNIIGKGEQSEMPVVLVWPHIFSMNSGQKISFGPPFEVFLD